MTYTYDGDGNRVKKSSGKLYWYGSSSVILDESDATGNVTNEYIFFGGKRLARRVVSSGQIQYYFADHLGSSRVVTDASGNILDDADFYPFGGERTYSSSSGNSYKFTGKERDTESGLDDFGARYFTSQYGRFMTPDWSASPVLVPYADLGNPQTFNLYSYVANNPLNSVDPEGHFRLDCGSHPPHYNDPDDGVLYGQAQDTAAFETWAEAAQAPQQQNTQTQQTWSSLSATQQDLVGDADTWADLSVGQRANFAAISHALEKTTLSDGTSALEQVRTVTSIGEQDIAVTWEAGAKQAFKDSGFSWRPGWGHSGENGVTKESSVTGLHLLFGDKNPGIGHVHIDYRGLFEGHYQNYNSDVRAVGPERRGGQPINNYETYKSWFGPIPGYTP